MNDKIARLTEAWQRETAARLPRLDSELGELAARVNSYTPPLPVRRVAIIAHSHPPQRFVDVIDRVLSTKVVAPHEVKG